MGKIRLIAWANGFTESLAGGKAVNVPCDNCTACCRSHMFILIRPTDYPAKAAIPSELRFRAPGLPEGYEVLGFNEKGHCPMLQDNHCTVYYDRPQTCKQFDCRVYSAADVAPDESNLAEVFDASKQFSFDRETNDDTKLYQTIQAILMAFETVKSPTKQLIPQYSSARLALAVEMAISVTAREDCGVRVAEIEKNIEQLLQEQRRNYA